MSKTRTWTKESVEFFEKRGEKLELLPKYEKAARIYESQGLTFDEVKSINVTEASIKTSFAASVKFKVLAISQEVLKVGGKLLGGYEIYDAGRKVYEASPEDKALVEYEQIGKLAGGEIGKYTGIAAGGLIEFFVPGVSTPVAIAAVAGFTVAGEQVGEYLVKLEYESNKPKVQKLRAN